MSRTYNRRGTLNAIAVGRVFLSDGDLMPVARMLQSHGRRKKEVELRLRPPFGTCFEIYSSF
jgi:hypothetical protein